MKKNMGLGKGVGLLFGEEPEKYFECDIAKISPNRYQPRDHFSEEGISDLADSIREQGVIQPLLVRSAEGGNYELIAGERRLRASKLAGLSTVPVVTLDVEKNNNLLELALIENVQRKDLSPIEEAEAYQKLIEEFGYTQEKAAKRVGKSRSTITNLLRLLKLPKSVKTDILLSNLSEGHGRTLLKLVDFPDKLELARETILRENLSVRQSEKLVKKLSSQPRSSINSGNSTKDHKPLPDSYIKSLTTQLTNRLNSKVSISQNGTRGKIEIDYYSVDDLDRVIALLVGEE